MARDEDKTPSLMDKNEFKTLEEFFAAEKKHIAEAQQLRLKYAKETAAAQEREMKRAIREWVREEQILRESGIKNLFDYQMQLIREMNEEDFRRKLEVQNRIYKQQVEESKASTKKQRAQDAINRKEDNEAWIKFYNQLEENGQDLTKEQKKDRDDRLKQIDLANKSFKEQQKLRVISEAMKATLNAVNANMTTYAKYQGGINARLQGSSLGGGATTVLERLRYGTNTFGILENRLTSAVGIQPYVRSETLLNNLDALVREGIAANVEQRAFLNTVKDNIAETFDAANASLLRIIRLQQSDSTAARLGMEAYLTRFLNKMTESTEYLNQTFDNVEAALLEASSQMTMKASTEFEYVVQKWLGALTGTGLSEATAQNIAQAIGYLGSGNVSGFGESSVQGLLTIAASRSGLDIGSLLNGGLTAKTTNALLNAIANYMVEIGANQNNVVRSQLAQTFGLSISDITAAQQLSKDFRSINANMLSYGGMYGALNNQMLALPTRLSMAEMVQNVFDNSLFSMAKNMAENPVLAALWKVTDMIEGVTGGINIPAIEALTVGTGGMIDLNTTVENLMKLGLVGISSLGMIGDVISGIGSSVVPSSMLWRLGITSGNAAITRGGGLSNLVSGFTTSQSSYVSNSGGNDYYEQSLQKGADDANNNETLKPQTDESQTDILPNIDKNVEGILSVLKDMKTQMDSIRTRLDSEFEVSDINRNNYGGILV